VKLIQYLISILDIDDLKSIFLKASSINVFFTIFADEQFDEFYVENKLQAILEKMLEELDIKMKFN